MNIANVEGTRALMKAVSNGNLSIAKILIGAGATVNAINSRCSTALIQASTDLLLRSGVDVNIMDNGGGTTLISTTFKGFLKCLNVLIKAGADVNANSSRALHEAALHDRTECLQVLLKVGAQVNLRDTSGKHPL